MKRLYAGWFAVAILCPVAAQPSPLEETAGEPLRYTGDREVDRRFYHGGVPPAVGVHRHQVYRANRTRPSEGTLMGHTYNHGPNLAWWKGRFWVHWLDTEKEEHNPPSRTMIATSADGRTWGPPKIAFPVTVLPEFQPPAELYGEMDPVPAGMTGVYHQRMGFYTAPNGRFLTLSFLSYCFTPRHSPNSGQGLGRLVREVYEDGTFGPIYFIRYNRGMGWNEDNTPYPYYRTSTDAGFVEACEALLADRLTTLQWWEEEQSRDGFYALEPEPGTNLSAFAYFERPDGVLVGMWKGSMTALSADGGRTWTSPVRSPTLKTVRAKLWGQRLSDGRYALVYNHSATGRNRYPLIIMTGEDGHRFDNMLEVHGEAPPIRYQGLHRPHGPQYIRGIIPGNGVPPDGNLWLTYSVNKEDMWVARVRVPVSGTTDVPLREDFQSRETVAELDQWNLYSPLWAPVSIAPEPGKPKNRVLQLVDEDPWDYAKAEAIFPDSERVTVEFRAFAYQIGTGMLEVEVQDAEGRRTLRLRFDPDWISYDLGRVGTRSVPPTQAGVWRNIRLEIDCAEGHYDLWVDGELFQDGIRFAEDVTSVRRLVFRTGPWRMDVRSWIMDGEPANRGLDIEDLPGADVPVARSIYLIDDVRALSGQ